MKTVKIIHTIAVSVLACCCAIAARAEKMHPLQPLTLVQASPLGENLYDNHRWSLLYYYGQTVNGALVGTVVGNFTHWPEHIQTLELAYTLDENNVLRHLVHPLVGVVQVAGNFTVRNGSNENTIYELDPYVIFRWANWPWNDKVTTSLGFAEGISYVSSVPYIEKRDNTNTRRLLNYLMFELTLSPPKSPQWQFVLRVHHRSGAYGLYGADNTGSNDIGAGIRYLF